MTAVRIAFIAVVLVAAVILQNAVLDFLSVRGVVPNLVLLLVVAAALARGLALAAPVAFIGGLLLDLAPPADHLLGAWAVCLIVAAVMASRVRDDANSAPIVAVLTVAVCSFVATSMFAFSTLITSTHPASAGQFLAIIGIGVLWDVALAPWLLPPLVKGFERLRPAEYAR